MSAKEERETHEPFDDPNLSSSDQSQRGSAGRDERYRYRVGDRESGAFENASRSSFPI